ncbi:FeoA family protein [Kocuria tytonis]|uniref:Ferrous iron transport protein A n=1 Tax=Kocuria tytonis TaxID=2054280 RepID=A0A495A6Q4_9MICC|nr:FeoA family protein [Kocuria tytonis]RKQ35404.1 ferrous iron transport protein A [Kocuria tytonis]
MKRSKRESSAPSCATLCDVKPGEDACITLVEGALDPVVRRRLGALGFREGEQVTCLRRAPMGSPILFRVCGAEVCLRKEQARSVRVAEQTPEPVAAAS